MDGKKVKTCESACNHGNSPPPHTGTRRYRERRRKLLFLSLLFAVASLIPLSAQSARGGGRSGAVQPPAATSRAVLVRGTIPVSGLDFFPTNALPAYEGEYRFRNDSIRIWFTREVLFFSSEWAPRRYGELPGFESTSGSRRIFAFREAGGYYLIIDFPENAAWISSFITVFRARFDFFLQSAKSDAEISFPAIIEVPS
jgi:hypothetical protein